MNPCDKLAIIADDYTGAGDSGIQFFRAGRKVELLLRNESLDAQLSRHDTVALSSESRFFAPQEAASAVSAIIRQCQAAGYSCFFKKLDSTMRGNPGAETEAALETTGLKAALVCTAMPRTGRTCLKGTIYLDGRPLHTTDIGRDPFHPVTTSSVPELLSSQINLPMGSLSLDDIEGEGGRLARTIRQMVESGVRIIVADAVTQDHLSALARQTVDSQLLPVGAGGFAEALADVLEPTETRAPAPDTVAPQGPILAVVGSLAGVSRRQADHAQASGLFRAFEIHPFVQGTDLEKVCLSFIRGLENAGPNILLRVAVTDRPARITTEEGSRIATLLGIAASVICRNYSCRTVFSTGGSTSMAIARALGMESVNLVGEIMPGVVLGACNAADSGIEWFISKAGGFGDKTILTEIATRSSMPVKGV